jgi:hypothetical protein
MRGSHLKFLTALARCAVVCSFVVVAACRPEEAGEQKKMALNLPRAPAKRPQGMSALLVRTGGVQPFSKQDVVNYFKTHNLPMNLSSPAQFNVASLEFLTDKEVSERLQGASPGLAPDERVAFATLQGSFIFTGPPSAKTVRFSRAYAVFDTRTGNLLMIGTLGQPEPPR